jgi:hypothetical protein
VRAVAREAAFEQGEPVDFERFGGKTAGAFEERGDLAAAPAFPPRQREVRVERAALGFEARRLAYALDLGGERNKRRLRFDPRP